MSQQLTRHQTSVMSFRKLAESPAYINRFKQVLKDRAPQFIASLVQLVSGSTYLSECDPNSIMAAAITAAALDLPIDKNLGFAHVVPYAGVAAFQMGYKGFVQLAIRSGQYRFLNYVVVKRGDLQSYNELTGEVVLDPTKREKEAPVVGYAAYFKLNNGYEHAEYWTLEEVKEHALRYSQAYKKGKDTPWKTDFDAMALKTVIKSLISHWGIMSIEMQRAVVNDQGVRADIDSDDIAYPDGQQDAKTPTETGPPIDIPGTVSDAGTDTEGTDLEAVRLERLAAARAATAESDPKPQQQAPPPQKEPLPQKSPTVGDPYNAVRLLCKKSDVMEDAVLAYAKKRNLCSEGCVELIQVSEANLSLIATTWNGILSAIREIK